VLFAKFERLSEKIFSSIAHIEESSKNYFAEKRRQTKQQASNSRCTRSRSSLGIDMDLIIWRHSEIERGVAARNAELTSKHKKQVKRVAV